MVHVRKRVARGLLAAGLCAGAIGGGVALFSGDSDAGSALDCPDNIRARTEALPVQGTGYASEMAAARAGLRELLGGPPGWRVESTDDPGRFLVRNATGKAVAELEVDANDGKYIAHRVEACDIPPLLELPPGLEVIE